MAMIQSLGLATQADQTEASRRPSCDQVIDPLAARRLSCSSSTDHDAPDSGTDNLGKVVRASTDIVYLKFMACATAVLYLLSWMPMIGVVGHWGFLFLLVALPVGIMIWWRKHHSIQTNDLSYARAKRFTYVAALFWCVMLFAWQAVPVLYPAVQLLNLGDSQAIVVLEDVDGFYWAIPVEGIKRKSLNEITIENNYLVSEGRGYGTSAFIAETYIAHGYDRSAELAELSRRFGERRYYGPLLGGWGTLYQSVDRYGNTSEHGVGGSDRITKSDLHVKVKRVLMSRPLKESVSGKMRSRE